MWIFMNDAFLSVVQLDEEPDFLMVRARQPQDIPRVFPSATVVSLPNRDYAFRARIPRKEVAAAIAEHVTNINYTNFKDSVDEEDRIGAYVDVWAAMRWFQDENPR